MDARRGGARPSKTSVSAIPPGQYRINLQQPGFAPAPPPMSVTPGAQRGRAQPMSIDPNGRFATTYRPGRGHLSRFESAMLKGRVPEPALALVAEVGRGSGAGVAAPTEKALAMHIATEMSKLPPEGGPVHLALTLRSTAATPAGRPEMAVHLVMDTSGSMSGAAIEQARQAALQLVGLLQPEDRFSLVSYNSGASVVVADGPVGSRHGQIVRQISQIRAGGGTNLEAGLRMGYAQSQASRQGRDSVQLVIVISDGRANQGVTDPWALSELSAAAFQSGAETTTIGVGDNYDPLVMSTIADYGAGGYYYLPDASTIQQVLEAELNVRSQPVARGVELRVRLGPGVELLQAYGSRRLNELEASRVRATEVAIDHQTAHRDGIDRDRQEDRQGGMRFFIPGFARDDQHTVLLRLRVPAGGASRPALVLADVELRYKDRVLRQNQGDERRVSVAYASSQQQALSSQDRRVRRAVLTFRTGEALAGVSGQLASGDQARAVAVLHERSRLLRAAAQQLNDAALRAEAERLDAFRAMLVSQGIGNRLMLGALVQRAGSSMIR
jgi:Ca-activated chloride channel family protein